MSNPKIHINPLAKSKHSHEHHKKTRNLLDQFAQKFSWVIILVFSISTFTALGLIFNEIKGNIGLAAQDLSAYNTWKIQYGLKASDNDSNWNKSGDGVSNYNKYLLGLNPNTTLDGSVIASIISGSSTSGSMPEIVGSKDPIVDTLQAKGPNLVDNNSSTSGSTGRSTTSGTTSSGNIQPNIGGANSPTINNPNTQVPILSNPTPSSNGKITAPNTGSSSSGTTIVTPNTGSTTVAGSSSSGTNTTANSQSNTTSSAINNSATTNTVKTSGTNASTSNSTAANTGTKTSGTTAALATKKTTTVRTGGEFNLILFLAGLASLASGVYILKNKFVKNSLAVHEGEK